MSTPTTPVPVSPGQVVGGKYRIDEVIGRRGTGLIVRAEHLGLDQPVAIKLLDASLTTEHVERFFREARAAARIPSPHVVRVLDTDRLDTGQPYIVMELLEGMTLRRLVAERGPLPLTDAVDYVLQASEAVARAHRAGVVHRDLRPANLFLTRDEGGAPCVKVLDFGICKLQSPGADDPKGRLTGAIPLVGSPNHMAPEQWAAAAQADQRCDIWALGAVLYELLAARPAFDGPDLAAICQAVQQVDPPALGTLRPEIPAPLLQTVARCLRKSPAERYADVETFSRDLAPFASPLGRAALDELLRHSRPHEPSGAGRGVSATASDGGEIDPRVNAPTELGSAPTVLGSSPTLDDASSQPQASPSPGSGAGTPTAAPAPAPARRVPTIAMPPVVRPPAQISVSPPPPGMGSLPPPASLGSVPPPSLGSARPPATVASVPPPGMGSLPPPATMASLPPPGMASAPPPAFASPTPPSARSSSLAVPVVLGVGGCLLVVLVAAVAAVLLI